MNYLGLDIGTSMIKGQLLSENGNILLTREFESPVYNKDGVAFINAKKMKEIFKCIIEELANASKEQIGYICANSLGEAFVALDKDGNELNDFILFISDLGENETKQLLKNITPEEVSTITGLYPNKMFSFSKLMWIKSNHPEIYKRIHKILSPVGYLNYFLTGKYSYDYSLASRTMLFDIKKLDWSDKMINACGLNRDFLPQAYRADEIVGEVKSIKSLKGCKVLAGGHDQMMATLGAGLYAPHTANDGTGTAECITVVMDKIPDNAKFYKNNFCVVPYLIEGTYLTYAILASCGSLLKWHRDNLSPLEKEQYKDGYYAHYSSMDVPLPTSLIAVPYFSGSGTPRMDSGDKGLILGLTSETTKEEIYFALMEGAAYEMKYNLELLDEVGIKVEKLTVTGGGSKSDKWLEIKANVYQREVNSLATPEGGIYGCYLAIRHSKENIDYEILLKNCVKTKKTWVLNEKLSEKYSKLYKKYRQICSALNDTWR